MKRKIRIFFDAGKLNIFELNSFYSNEKNRLIERDFFRNKLKRKHGIFIGIVISIVNPILNLFRDIFFRKYNKLNRNSNWFFILSNNCLRSIFDLNLKIPQSEIIGYYPGLEKKLLTGLPKLLSFPFIPLVLSHYFSSSGYRRDTFKYLIRNYIDTFGYYIYFRLLIRSKKPRSVCITNDHNFLSLTMIKACKDEGIPTIYIQHASVSKLMPPLSVDYALLEGKYSVDLYNSVCKIRSKKVFLSGQPKNDVFNKMINVKSSIETIGICTNEATDIEATISLIESCRQYTKQFKFIFRPHPADKRIEFLQQKASLNKIMFSHPIIEESYSFLRYVDAIISTNSNIILEAVLLNVHPFMFSFGVNSFNDGYGFVKNGIVTKQYDKAEEIFEEILRIKNNKPNVRYKAKYYNELIDTPRDGKSIDLIRDIYANIDNGMNNLINWQQSEDYKNTCVLLPK